MTETLANRFTRLLARRRRSDLSSASGQTAVGSPRPGAVGSAAAPVLPAVGGIRPPRSLPVAPTVLRRPGRPALRCTVDPADERRTLISGRMSEVCDALDRLVARQSAAAVTLHVTQVGPL